jgi:hypothetical protein
MKKILLYCVLFFTILLGTHVFQEDLIHLIRITFQSQKSHPVWLDLTQEQQDILLPIKEDWQNLTSSKRIVLFVLTKRILKLDKRNISIFQERVQGWYRLSLQETIKERDLYLDSLEISQNDKIQTWKTYQELTPDEKQLLERQAFQKKKTTVKN